MARQNGFTDGLTWCRGKLGIHGNLIWAQGGRQAALALYESSRLAGTRNNTCAFSRLEWGKRYWVQAGRRGYWKLIVDDSLTDYSYPGEGSRTSGEDTATIAADGFPANLVCFGPFPEDLCYPTQKVEVLVIRLEQYGYAPGSYLVCVGPTTTGAPLFSGAFSDSIVDRVELVFRKDDPESKLIFAAISRRTVFGVPVAGFNEQVSPYVARWDGLRWTVPDYSQPENMGVRPNVPVPDRFEFVVRVNLTGDPAQYTVENAEVGPNQSTQIFHSNSVTIRTRYRDFEGNPIWGRETVFVRVADGAQTLEREPQEPTIPKNFVLADTSESRVIQTRSTLDPLQIIDVPVWRHKVTATWEPGDGTRQALLVVQDYPASVATEYIPIGNGLYLGALTATAGSITSDTWVLEGGVSEQEFDVIPGALVRVYLRGEMYGGGSVETIPGEAVQRSLTVPRHGLRDPRDWNSTLIKTVFQGEGNLDGII